MNAVDMYKAFLKGIDKGRTVVVRIPVWNEFINLIVLDWVNEQIDKTAFQGVRVPDLESLHIDTDGVSYEYIAPMGGSAGAQFLFEIPRKDKLVNVRHVTSGQVFQKVLPELYHPITVQFKIEADGQISDWLPARLVKTHQRGFINDNTYTQPLDDRLYFEVVGQAIRLATGVISGKSVSKGYAMRFEYYTRPPLIEIDEAGTIPPISDIDFTTKSKKNIVDMAVRVYLEQKTNPRWQSYLQEMIIKTPKT